LSNENHYEICKQQTIDKNTHTNNFRDYHGDDKYFASVEANLVTFIVKNLLSKGAIVTFVTDRELYFT